MPRVRRSRVTGQDRLEIWDRWKRGESLSDIGRAVDRIPGAVFHVLAARGGVPPVARYRSSAALTLVEREEISRGLAAGVSFRQLGARLGRAPSTVSREVGRHSGRRWYRAATADAVTHVQSRRDPTRPPLLQAHQERTTPGGPVPSGIALPSSRPPNRPPTHQRSAQGAGSYLKSLYSNR